MLAANEAKITIASDDKKILCEQICFLFVGCQIRTKRIVSIATMVLQDKKIFKLYFNFYKYLPGIN